MEDNLVASACEDSVSSPQSHEVPVPLQLFQATGNVGSSRDRDSITWNPQPCFPSHDGSRLGSSSRCENPPPHALNEPIAVPNAYRRSHPSESEVHRSYVGEAHIGSPECVVHTEQPPLHVQGPANSLHDTLHSYRRKSHESSTPTPSLWSTTNPFATSHDSIQVEAAHVAPPDPLLVEPNTEKEHSQSAGTHQDTAIRRGTLQSIVDAIVPDVVQRTFTNASYARRSSMWHTYEKAKERGAQIQRKPYVQVGFEYGIYAIIILFIYFVLVGVPLWKGAVYWLWWVVAHKFVIAGSFSTVTRQKFGPHLTCTAAVRAPARYARGTPDPSPSFSELFLHHH